MEGYILGIDGGGTKTIAVISDLNGNILGKGISGASNYQTVGLDYAIGSIKKAFENALLDAGISLDTRVKIACLGLAGSGRESDRVVLIPAIEKLGFADKIILEHDAVIALAGATNCQPGVIVIAGTGSIAFGKNHLGQQCRSGGWGNILGDEGSAYYIGRKALNSACKAYDERGSKTKLLDALMKYMGLSDFTDIVNKIYSQETTHQTIASIAPLVSESAKNGDKVAIEILKDAGKELALACVTIIKKLNMENENFLVAISGSVFNAGDFIILPFTESVKSLAPYAEIISPKFEPVIGALLLAYRGINQE